MNKIIAPYGIICIECPAYEATQANDWEKLAQVAAKWSDENYTLEPKDMLCDGCFSEKLHSFCAECGVRKCALGQGYQVCSQCSDYACTKLKELWDSFSSSSEDELRESLEHARII